MRERKRNPARSTCNVLHFKEKYPWQSRHHVLSDINAFTSYLGNGKNAASQVGFITHTFGFLSCGCDKILQQKQLRRERFMWPTIQGCSPFGETRWLRLQAVSYSRSTVKSKDRRVNPYVPCRAQSPPSTVRDARILCLGNGPTHS